ncbi:hypothetical protein CN367_11830 [Priestia megaterium]|uniref:hypothetical protein n=1 Tax=Priestia megaterium TaxID=1404 RepID=UPI000BF93C74|nr:hypothetical protein [Priestia megaterium]PEZ47049.1 hypothetical protein CN367_11830 [Priestia megaterium]
MSKMQTIKFSEFMTGDYKVKEARQKKAKQEKRMNTVETLTKVGASLAIPVALGSPLGAIIGGAKVFATSNAVATSAPVMPEAVPVNATEWASGKSLEMIAHALDPVIQVLVALSFPVASVIIVGGCFWFMFGNSEKAWKTIQNASLGYVLIQMSPLILNILKQIGGSI